MPGTRIDDSCSDSEGSPQSLSLNAQDSKSSARWRVRCDRVRNRTDSRNHVTTLTEGAWRLSGAIERLTNDGGEVKALRSQVSLPQITLKISLACFKQEEQNKLMYFPFSNGNRSAFLLNMGVVDMKEEVPAQSTLEKVMWFERNLKAILSNQWVLNCRQGCEIEWGGTAHTDLYAAGKCIPQS